MADQEEDFSSLPLTDRWVHKNWKVRKEAYEAAVKEFDAAQTENDSIVRQFTNDTSLWKGAVTDSNVAAHQEGLGALCSFLQIAGLEGCRRTRNITIVPIVEKGLAATRPAVKQKAIEAILLYIELDKGDPIVEEMLTLLSHKQPKIIAAMLGGLREIYHAYGCKTVDPKQTLKVLPKPFGHADKNVRAEAQNLTVEMYKWLKDAMKPLFWNELKPVQQQDLEKLFEKVKDEPPPKQERLLRSQQAAKERAPAAGPGGLDAEDDGADIEIEEDVQELLAVNVFPKIPKDFQERIASSKWKERKEALDELHTAVNVPAIEEGPFDEIVRSLAKCMKDANIAVVTVAANCIELLAKGLRKSFGKQRSTVMGPMMERLKEKKQAVADAIGAALDGVFASTHGFSDCLEEMLTFLVHKNPQVKLESTRFLIRSLRTTRDAPTPEQVKAISDVATKLLTDSQEVQRSAGAEVLGTLWKIMGDRMMNVHLEGLDEIRKTKIKEFHDSAEVKAKFKPKAAAAPKGASNVASKRQGMVGPPAAARKTAPPPRRTAPAAAAPAPVDEAPPALAPRQTSRPGSGLPGPPGSKLGRPKSMLVPPGATGLKKPGGIPGPASSAASPRRALPSAEIEPEEQSPTHAAPPPRMGLAGRGLTGRPLGKPALDPTPEMAPPILSTAGLSGLSTVERAELDELRAEAERLRRQNDEMKQERMRLTSQINELQNQNAQLIEDHTRDMLSIKAKETQLVRARSDAEAAEQTVLTQRREVERLKREMSRLGREVAGNGAMSPISNRADPLGDIYSDAGGGYGRPQSVESDRMAAVLRPGSAGEGKENLLAENDVGRSKLSPVRGAGFRSPTSARYGMGANGATNGALGLDGQLSRSSSSASGLGRSAQGAAAGGESWKRAAEVTQNLKARIELMKAKQGIVRPQ